jgi:hypothetical protein
VPTDRVIDGCDQSAFVTGKQEHSNRDYFPMFFDHLHVGMRYKNFKVLTHKIEHGLAPIQQLAIPHVQNLTVNPDEDTPANYELGHSWVLQGIRAQDAGTAGIPEEGQRAFWSAIGFQSIREVNLGEQRALGRTSG